MSNPKGNPATLKPPFTSETARAAVLKFHAQRKADLVLAKSIRLYPIPATDDARKNLTLAQIDKLDLLINNALDNGDEARFLRLTAAKERLWKLVSPTAGVLKPKRRNSGGALYEFTGPVGYFPEPQEPPPMPIPVEQEPVVLDLPTNAPAVAVLITPPPAAPGPASEQPQLPTSPIDKNHPDHPDFIPKGLEVLGKKWRDHVMVIR
jgi:hypothetical protein